MQGRKSVFDWWCWGVILSLTFQVHLCGRLVIHADVRRKSTLSLSLSLSLALSLSLSAALIPRQVLQCACSVGSSCLIVCYYFNTYIMYFIKICCQSLSVPLHPITQGPPPLIYSFLFIYFCCHHLPSLVCLSFTARNSIILAVVLWCCHDTQWRIHYLISFLACLDSSIRSVIRKVPPSVFCFAKCAQSEDSSLFLLIKWKMRKRWNEQTGIWKVAE